MSVYPWTSGVLDPKDMGLPLRTVKKETSVAEIVSVPYKSLMRELVMKLNCPV